MNSSSENHPDTLDHYRLFLEEEHAAHKKRVDAFMEGETHILDGFDHQEPIRKAILAERERCAQLIEALFLDTPINTATVGAVLERIREGVHG